MTRLGYDYVAVRICRGAPVQLIAGTGRTLWHVNDRDGVLRLSKLDEIAEWAWEIVTVTYAMSSLDTPVYHDYLREFAPDDPDALVVDIGGGDGRNALPWLQWGFRRVVVIDATVAGLTRFRNRVAQENPAWLGRLLLIQCDARALPLATAQADRIFAVEVLYYLNEDYELGPAECHRAMRPHARLLLADRSYDLLTRLLYFGGLGAMLETARNREMWDGQHENGVRTRCFRVESSSP